VKTVDKGKTITYN